MTPGPVQQVSPPPSAESLEERFRRLAATWQQAVAHPSSGPFGYSHPAYQEIIRMGREVVPLLLRDLASNRRHWFWALHRITGADPVAQEDRGSLTRMVEAWLRWGRTNGYLVQDGAPVREDGAQGAGPPSGGSDASPKELETSFQQLAAIWRAETRHLSSSTARTRHPAYQEIIGLGMDVVPLLLRDLERGPDFWFAALQALTGANPMEPADRGKLDTIAAAWLRWGRANGYQW